jgi:hypothetical protein
MTRFEPIIYKTPGKHGLRLLRTTGYALPVHIPQIPFLHGQEQLRTIRSDTLKVIQYTHFHLTSITIPARLLWFWP